jgi:hypothetical protein
MANMLAVLWVFGRHANQNCYIRKFTFMVKAMKKIYIARTVIMEMNNIRTRRIRVSSSASGQSRNRIQRLFVVGFQKKKKKTRFEPRTSEARVKVGTDTATVPTVSCKIFEVMF